MKIKHYVVLGLIILFTGISLISVNLGFVGDNNLGGTIDRLPAMTQSGDYILPRISGSIVGNETIDSEWDTSTANEFCLTEDSCITSWAAGSMVYPEAGIAISTGSAWASSTVDNSANWDTAYGWGDHNGLYDTLGQATSTLTSHTITYNHGNYDTAYGWGDHASAGYSVGAVSSTDNAVVRFDSTTGKLLQNSSLIVDDFGRINPSSLGGSTFIGTDSGINDDLTYNYNTGVGNSSLSLVSTGNYNSSFGSGSMTNITSGTYNTGIGANSMQSIITASYNSALGALAGSNYTGGGFLRTPSNSTFLGAKTQALAESGTNETVIGYFAIGHGSNTVTLGNTSVNATYLNGTINVDGSYTIPATDGTSNQVLKTDGSGSLTWQADSDTTYVSSDFNHDDLTGFVANEHIDWTTDQGATNIDAGNYIDTNTTYTAGGTLLDLTSTTFSLNEGTLTNGKLCTYVSGTGLVCNSDDANTTYTAGDHITLTGTDFDVDPEAVVYKSKIAFETPTELDDFFFGEISTAVTFTSIYCKTLVGTADIDISIAGSDINGTDITCTTAGVLDDSLGGDTAGAVGEEVQLLIESVASDPTYIMVELRGTYND